MTRAKWTVALAAAGCFAVALGLVGRAALSGRGSAAVPTAPAVRGDFVHRVWAEGTLDWKAVADLVDRSYRLVALKRMVAALEDSRFTA